MINRGYGTQSRGRTGTILQSLEFESSASTNSAIWAGALDFLSKAKTVFGLRPTKHTVRSWERKHTSFL